MIDLLFLFKIGSLFKRAIPPRKKERKKEQDAFNGDPNTDAMIGLKRPVSDSQTSFFLFLFLISERNGFA